MTTEPRAASELGRTIAGKYALRRQLGEGGMGAVYEAEHVELGKRVAIKIVRALHAGQGEISMRFRREARAASAVDSEHIVEVFDVGEDPELGLYMVMELLDGEDLGALLARVRRLEPALALTIARQAALGLDKAHAAGVVHRDLKPANVFLRARDACVTVKLVDFGIAKLVRDAQEGGEKAGVTRAGSVLGTPSYMSPEQAQGLPTVDLRTDLYSLGAVLYEMLVGEAAFPDRSTYEQTIIAIVTQPAPRVSAKVAVAPELDALVAELMSREPDARPPTARDVAERIAGLEPRSASLRLSTEALSRGSLSGADAERKADARAATPRTSPGVSYDKTLAAPPERRGPSRAVYWTALAALAFGIAGAWIVLRKSDPPSRQQSGLVGTAAPALAASAAPAAAPSGTGAPTIDVVPAPPSIEPTPAAPASATPSAAASASAPRRAPGTAKAGTPAGKPGAPPAKPGGQVGGAGITTDF